MQVDARARIETGLVGSGIVVGGVAVGSGAVGFAERIHGSGHAKLWRDLEAAGSMSADQFSSHMRHFRRTAELPATALHRTGVAVALGSVLVGGVMIGAALIGGD